MRIEIHNYTHYPEIDQMSEAIENLRREVAEAKAGQASAIVLIEGIRDQLNTMLDTSRSFAELKAEVDTLATDLSDSTDALSAAVASPPTPAEPTPILEEPPVG